MVKVPSIARIFLVYLSLSILDLVQSFNSISSITVLPNRCTTHHGKLHAKSDTSPDETDVPITAETNRTVTIISRGPNHIVALKPPSVVCHHSGWTGSRSKMKRGEEPEIPMLQRVRDGIHDIDTRGLSEEEREKACVQKVNLVHRLDRGASGALLLTFANNEEDSHGTNQKSGKKKGATASLIEAMASPESLKTYVALVRGEGIFRGEDFKEKGWFEVSRPIKDEGGEEKEATTMFNFVAGQPETCEDGVDRPRMSLVLARPKQGRWHQIRRHLNGLSHPILGDTTHGASKVNREWKEKRNLPGERLCLHMGRMQLPPTEAVPEGIDISCPILDDMMNMLKVYAPDVLKESIPILEEEGIILEAKEGYSVGKYNIPEELLPPKEKKVDDHVDILEIGDNYVVASKPPSVVVHHSSWTGKRSDPNRRWKEATPMLQRVRDATGRKVNLIHRLDRGASGCLVFSFSENRKDENGDKAPCRITKSLIESMQSPEATKTYLALCDGDGTWNGVDYLQKGWFTFDKPVKDEWGKIMEGCRTDLRFIVGKTLPPVNDDDENYEGRKICIVLARPHTGRWHQVRQHLSSGTIGHAILGDSSHGRSRTNRIWKKKRHLIKERTCLHLSRVQLPATEYAPNGIDISCPLTPDLEKIMDGIPGILDEVRPILLEEGISV